MKIGELWISLGLNTASFTTNLNNAKKLAFGSAKEFERSFKIIGTAVASAGIAAATSLVVMTKRGIDAADRMRDLSLRSGTTVESFSLLAYAAEQSGLSADDLANGLGKLSKVMGEAARGGNEQLAALKGVGISQEELLSGSVTLEGALSKIAKTVSTMPGRWQKSDAAMRFFGKSGAVFNEFLRQGDEGIARLIARGEKLGQKISTDFAISADKFKDSWKDVNKQLDAFELGLAEGALPALNQVASKFGEAELGLRKFGSALSEAATGMALVLAGQKNLFSLGLPEFMKRPALPESLRPPGIPPQFAKMFEPSPAPLKTTSEAIQKMVDALKLQIIELQLSPAAFAAYKAGLDGARPSMQKFIFDLTAIAQQLKATQGGFIGPQSPLEFLNENLASVTISTKEFDEAFERQRERMAEGRRVWESVLDPIGKYSLELQKLTVLLNAGAIDTATFKTASDNLAESLGLVAGKMPAVDESLRRMQESMRGFSEQSLRAFGDWLIFGGSFRGVLQGIVQDLARMFFQLLVIEPLMKSIFRGSGGGGGGGFNFAGLLAGFGGFGGWFQHGGPVWPGKPIVVGERGPELFMPPVRGDIIPNHALRTNAGMGNQVVNIDARGADHGSVIKIAALMSRAHSRELLRRIRDAEARTA